MFTLGVIATSQAQGLTKVQNDVTITNTNPYNISTPIFERTDFAKTNVICFVHKDNTLENRIRIITTDSAYVRVLANTYDLKSHELKNGKHIFEFGNKVKEARIYTNLVSVNSGKFHIHRVVHNS